MGCDVGRPSIFMMMPQAAIWSLFLDECGVVVALCVDGELCSIFFLVVDV